MAFSRELKGLLRHALENNRFEVHVQPIVSLITSQVSFWELLLRLPDTNGQLVQPAAFLGVAEQAGLMCDIDRWVLRRAIQLIRDLNQWGYQVCLDVNLSATALSDRTLVSFIQDELVHNAVNPADLMLEITETAAVSDFEQAQQFISTLKDLGCHFAIDDFGVGFSSFLHLKHLPVDYLKIDGGFVRNLPTDTVDQRLVQSIVQVAHALGKQAVAEWVGDVLTVNLLQEYGVEFAQGYYFGKPQPVSAIWPQLSRVP